MVNTDTDDMKVVVSALLPGFKYIQAAVSIMTVAQVASQTSKNVVRVVFIALVLDLLAFTMPLPLFPRLVAWYTERESNDSNALLSRLLALSSRWRALLVGGQDSMRVGGRNWDVVLLGGAMGSLFSFCQCLISPSLGSLSDRYGRKKVLLATMTGNLLSAVVWLRSTTFASFLLSRLIGGLSEGNVQLSTAIIGDVTETESRSKSLALIGIAFSVCFTFGPSLGAYFASRPPPVSKGSAEQWNIYAVPAGITLALLLVETTYLSLSLPETISWRKKDDKPVTKDVAERDSPVIRRQRLNAAGKLHGAFLLLFSGAEFTLTFLTYDLFAASNAQNGRLLSYIGILAAMLQARHVRPSLAKSGELTVSRRGVLACTIALVLLSILPLDTIKHGMTPTIVLYLAASCLAYTSATVVTGLTAAAAACCDDESSTQSDLKRGRAMGSFRSKGQLGRAIGPVLTSSMYFMIGPTASYALTAGCMVVLWTSMGRYTREESLRKKKKQ